MDAAAAAARRLRQKERRKVWRNQLEKTSDMLQQANSSCYGVPASVTSVLTKEQRTLRQRLGLDSTRKQRRCQNPVQVVRKKTSFLNSSSSYLFLPYFVCSARNSSCFMLVYCAVQNFYK